MVIMDRMGKKNCRFESRDAQSLLEYILLIGIITTSLLAMGTLLKRGIQGIVKITADQIGNQQNAEQKITPTSGYLIEAYTSTQSNIKKNTRELNGAVDYIFDDRVDTFSNSLVNLGFFNKE
jgi:hypothetical protein